MSYKLPKKPRKNATVFYQDRILIDKDNLLWVPTGPYTKEACGKTLDGVIMYYNHIKEIYDGYKKKMKTLKELED